MKTDPRPGLGLLQALLSTVIFVLLVAYGISLIDYIQDCATAVTECSIADSADDADANGFHAVSPVSRHVAEQIGITLCFLGFIAVMPRRFSPRFVMPKEEIPDG
jgi:hypothetical protein